MKTADEVLKEQFGHAYGMLHPFEISRITSAMQAYASQFNKPPVYGQWIDINVRQPEYMEVVLIAIRDLGTVAQAQYGGETDHFSIGDDWLNASHWMPLPPSPGSVDVEEKHQATYDFVDQLIVWQEQGKFRNWPEADTNLLNELIEQGKKAVKYDDESVKEVSREGEKSSLQDRLEALQEENEKLRNFIIELSHLIERIKNG